MFAAILRFLKNKNGLVCHSNVADEAVSVLNSAFGETLFFFYITFFERQKETQDCPVVCLAHWDKLLLGGSCAPALHALESDS